MWPETSAKHDSSANAQFTKEHLFFAIHFNKEKHVISDFEFIIVEQICNLSDNYSVDECLLTREAFWSAQLHTVQQYGLNKRLEFNSRNSTVYNKEPSSCYIYMYIFLHIFYIHIDFLTYFTQIYNLIFLFLMLLFLYKLYSSYTFYSKYC